MVKIAEKAKITVEKLKDLHQKLTRDIEWILLRFSLYYNSKKFEGSRLKERDQIYLLRRNVKITRSSNKLNHKKLSLFKIIRNIKGVSFELQFPLIIKIYPVFHISFLEPANLNISQNLAPEIYPDSGIQGRDRKDFKRSEIERTLTIIN
jgi:hypothetical protein